MENMLNKDIISSLDELINTISSSDKYQKYQKVKEKMRQNSFLMNLIASYKKSQQELVKANYYNERKKSKEIQEELDRKLEQLKAIPLYTEYIFLQEELNEIFQYIKEDLEHYFNKKLN